MGKRREHPRGKKGRKGRNARNVDLWARKNIEKKKRVRVQRKADLLKRGNSPRLGTGTE